jgi:hypothetical protein
MVDTKEGIDLRSRLIAVQAVGTEVAAVIHALQTGGRGDGGTHHAISVALKAG